MKLEKDIAYKRMLFSFETLLTISFYTRKTYVKKYAGKWYICHLLYGAHSQLIAHNRIR